MRFSSAVKILLVAVLAAVAVFSLGTEAAPPPSGGTIAIEPITGTILDKATGISHAITGNFAIQSFKNDGGVLKAVGILQCNDDAGGAICSKLSTICSGGSRRLLRRQIGVPIALPVSSPSVTGSCTIFDLVLGPLHLDLLGLVVDLNQVHLTITAQQGSGNLLGNLLCAVAHLLDNTGGPAGGLAGLLNNILRALGLA